MPSDHLPLLRWTPPTADLVPFPAVKRVGKIRRTAEILVESTGRAAAAHWKRTLADMNRQLERAGLDERVAAAEVAAFKNAVDVEIARRTHGRMRLATEDNGAA